MNDSAKTKFLGIPAESKRPDMAFKKLITIAFRDVLILIRHLVSVLFTHYNILLNSGGITSGGKCPVEFLFLDHLRPSSTPVTLTLT